MPCSAFSFGNAVPFDSGQFRQLVGRFDLMWVDTVSTGSPLTYRGQLTLWEQDSTRRFRQRDLGPPPGSPAGRPLAGAVRLVPADTTRRWRRLASTDEDMPGVEWVQGRLRLRHSEGFEGTGDNLRVRFASPAGFAGSWGNDPGSAVAIDASGRRLPDPAGYFCAFRLPRGA